MQLEESPFSLRHTVFGVLKTLVIRATQSNLDLTYEVDPQVPGGYLGDNKPFIIRRVKLRYFFGGDSY